MPDTLLDSWYTPSHLILGTNPINSQFIDEESEAQGFICLVLYCGPGMRTGSRNIKGTH